MANAASKLVFKATMDSSDFDLGMQRARKNTKAFEDQTKKANGQLRMIRGGFGQVGHQIQDVAVQLQMGQNAMLVFGQQGSQIASLFGPKGAIIGAFLAVGAALSMSLLPRLVGATQAMKDLEKQSEDLVDKFDELDGALKLEALRQAAVTEDDLRHAIKEANEEIDFQNRVLKQLALSTNVSQKQIDRANETIQKQEALIQLANQQLVILAKKVDGTTDSFEKQAEALKKEELQLRLTKDEYAEYLIMTSKASDKEKELLLARQRAVAELRKQREQEKKDRKQDAKEEAKAVKALTKEFHNEFKEIEKLSQSISDTIGDGFADAIIGTKSFSDAVGDMARSVVQDLTRMIIKKMIVDQLFGLISGAFSNFIMPGGNPMAMEGQAGFVGPMLPPGTMNYDGTPRLEGGGFTGFGARSGGMDGRGGFPAILHPNETVIDHTRGQSAGVVVNQTINIQTGVSQTVRAEINSLMPKIQESTKNAVIQERAKGGAYSKQLLGY